MLGAKVLEDVIAHAKNMTREEYLELFEKVKHVKGPNGEPSYYDQFDRGYFANLIERHGVVINAVYKHYKGNYYRVADVVADCETCEPVVIYEALYDNRVATMWCRKLASFVELLPDGVTKRFALKSPEAVARVIGEKNDMENI